VWDSPNSAGVIIDAVRCSKLALDRGIGGPLLGPSAPFMKSPPVQYPDDVAKELVESFAAGEPGRGLVGGLSPAGRPTDRSTTHSGTGRPQLRDLIFEWYQIAYQSEWYRIAYHSKIHQRRTHEARADQRERAGGRSESPRFPPRSGPS